MSKKKHKRKAGKAKNTSDSKNKFVIIAIALLAFLLYGNTLQHDYALDDDIYTKKNTYVQQGFSAIGPIFSKGSLYGFNGVNDAQYRPFALLNFMIETSIFGLDSHVSHFFNVLFYALCGIVLFLFLKRVLAKYPSYIPIVVTALFMCHPVHTEVVANIKSRDEILSFLFGVSSFYFLAKYLDTEIKKHLFYSSLCFFIAILSKETSLMFSFVIVLIMHFFYELRLKRMITLSMPYFAAVIVYMILRINALSSVTFNETIIVMNNALMAAETPAEMYATNFVMMGKYLLMLLYPHPLSWDYSYNQIPIVGWSDLKAIVSLLIYIALGAISVLLFRRRSIYSFSILFYFLTIILTSNLLVKIGATFGERFLFAPSLAFCICLPIGIYDVKKTNAKNLILGISSILCMIYAGITIPRNEVWKNNLELFKSGVITSPNSARTHLSLAIEYRTQAEKEQNPKVRQQYFDLSIKSFYDGIAIYGDDPDAYYNLGVTFYEKGDKDKALEAYSKTLEVKPGYVGALNNTGVIYFERQQYNEAEKYFSEVLKYDVNYADAYANIGAVQHNRKEYDKAIMNYEKAISLNPMAINVYDNLIKIYNFRKDQEKVNYYTQQKQQLLSGQKSP